MDLVIFNAMLYVGALLRHWYRHRSVDSGFLLLAVYSFVAIACVINYAFAPHEWNLQLWPFLYMFVVCMLFFNPFLFNSSTLYEKLYISSNKTLKTFVAIYIICAFIAIYYSVSHAIENLQSGNWKILRDELYNNDIAFYGNQLERFSKIFVDYLRPLAVVIFFYHLTLEHVQKKWLTILAISIITPSFLTAINTASRGIIINLSISLFAGYLIFRKGIPKNVEKSLKIGATFILVLFLIYTLAVTASRFEDSGQINSLLSYFGHSMLTFNYGIADSIDSYLDGKYFFDWFLPYLGISQVTNYNSLGTHFSTAFYTFVGAWYLDFGPVGTLLIAGFFPMLIGHRFKNKHSIDIADLYIFLFYFTYLVQGVFVIGRGNALPWIIALIIYGILKVIK